MKRWRFSRRTIAICFAGGIVHAILALWLSAVVRGSPLWGPNTPETLSGMAVVSVTVLGLVFLGGVPLALYYRDGLVTPVAALFLLFTWAFYSSFHHFEDARATDTTPIGLYTDSLFGLLWFVPLAIVLLLGLLEYLFRSRFDGRPSGTDFD